jgi:hypothetical protein
MLNKSHRKALKSAFNLNSSTNKDLGLLIRDYLLLLIPQQILDGELPDFKNFMKKEKEVSSEVNKLSQNIGRIEGFSSLTNEYDRIYKEVRVSK